MSESSLPILFADDTNFAMAHPDFGCLIRNANTTLEYVSRWFQMNKLSLNVNKSNYILFRTKNKTTPKQDSKLQINNTEIKQVSCAKCLGILVDERLSWGNHTEHVCKKIMKSYGIIRRGSSLVNQSCLMTWYHSLIYPYLTFQALFISFFLLSSDFHSYSVRGLKNFHLPLCRTSSHKSFIKFHGPRLWNSLDRSLKLISSYKTFRTSLVRYLLSRQNNTHV